MVFVALQNLPADPVVGDCKNAQSQYRARGPQITIDNFDAIVRGTEKRFLEQLRAWLVQCFGCRIQPVQYTCLYCTGGTLTSPHSGYIEQPVAQKGFFFLRE